MNMQILPKELEEEILVRAAQEELLLKLRFVSKSWQTLIDSLEFQKLRSLRHPTQVIITDDNYSATARNCKIYSARSLDSPETMKATMAEIENHPFPGPTADFLGSCNGVVYCSSDIINFLLWNPSTNQLEKLPSCPNIDLNSGSGRFVNYGLGYEAARNDYKVVRLEQFSGPRGNIEQYFQVYSLKSNSWKDLPKCPYFVVKDPSKCKGVFANNALHWIMCKNSRFQRECQVILALDLTTEKRHLVPLPQPVGLSRKIKTLRVLNGCLCLIVAVDSSQKVHALADMWMMMNYGAKNSWTKLRLQISGEELPCNIRVGYSSAWLKPIMHSRGSGKTYLVFKYDEYLIWCDQNGLVNQVEFIDGKVVHLVDCSSTMLQKGSNSGGAIEY